LILCLPLANFLSDSVIHVTNFIVLNGLAADEAAGRWLGLTPVAASRRLAALEQEFAAHGTPASLRDLQHHECLSTPATTHWTFDSNGRSVRQAIKGRFVADSVEALHEASLLGLGIVRLPNGTCAKKWRMAASHPSFWPMQR
jgi:DNA-binding transcriptional LysR family regulator